MKESIKAEKLPKGIDRRLVGKELIEMGYRVDTDGFLIGNTFEYYVTFGLPWRIHQIKNSLVALA